MCAQSFKNLKAILAVSSSIGSLLVDQSRHLMTVAVKITLTIGDNSSGSVLQSLLKKGKALRALLRLLGTISRTQVKICLLISFVF